MTKFALTDHLLGNLGPSDFFVPDTTARFPLGTMVTGEDVNGIYGFGEFIYLQAAGTISANQICIYNDGFQAATAPNTANTGRAAVVARDDMTANQYGWFQRAGGMIPVKAASSVAAGAAVGIDATTGGSVAANSAGRQLLGATSLRASTATRTSVANTKANSKTVKVNSAQGLFIGQAVTGTGIPASTTITGFDNDDNPILNNAATATGTATLTFTNTGYIEIAAPNGLTLQGAIT